MTKISEALYAVATKHIGTWEWAEGHNPKVLAFFAASGHPEIKNDETPWCAALVGSVLGEAGLPNTGSLLARSYLEYGQPVELSQAQRGDIVILKRGNSTWQGHVGFFDRLAGGRVYLLGGNQRNRVNVSGYDARKILGVRRAFEPKAKRSSIAKSTTLQATAVTAVAVTTATGTAVSALNGTAQIVVIVAALVALAGLAWIGRERLIKWVRGDR